LSIASSDKSILFFEEDPDANLIPSISRPEIVDKIAYKVLSVAKLPVSPIFMRLLFFEESGTASLPSSSL